jgi:hypothetical protein
LVLLILLALSIQPVRAAEPITVQQLEQKLAAPSQAPSSHNEVPMALLEDATLTQQIDNLLLSERLTASTLDGILKKHTFGLQAQRALLLLADRSALLDPPASELPDRPAPDADQQQHVLDAACPGAVAFAQLIFHINHEYVYYVISPAA